MLPKPPPRPVIDAENPLTHAQFAVLALWLTWCLETLRCAALARGVPKDIVGLVFDVAVRWCHELLGIAGADFAKAARGEFARREG